MIIIWSISFKQMSGLLYLLLPSPLSSSSSSSAPLPSAALRFVRRRWCPRCQKNAHASGFPPAVTPPSHSLALSAADLSRHARLARVSNLARELAAAHAHVYYPDGQICYRQAMLRFSGSLGWFVVMVMLKPAWLLKRELPSQLLKVGIQLLILPLSSKDLIGLFVIVKRLLSQIHLDTSKSIEDALVSI